MRGTSAKSLADILGSVGDLPGSDAGSVGDELFAVVRILDQSPALRRVLTDPSTEADAKARLADSVFGDKIDSAALNVLTRAVKCRWSSSRDLADALETVGVSAQAVAAEASGNLDELESQLFDFGQIVSTDVELRQILTDRTIAIGPRTELVESLLRDNAINSVTALAKQAVVARTASFEKSLAAFGRLVAERRDRRVANVRVAAPLDDAEVRRLAAALKAKYGTDVHINTIVDPSVIGGISVAIGAEVIDGTVSSRLQDARRRIAG